MSGMTDERLAEIRARIEIDEHYYLQSGCAPDGEAEWFADTKDLLAEVERLRADAARLDKLQVWHRAMTDAHYDQGDKFEDLFDNEGLDIRDAIDQAAGEDATWLPKGEPK